ncbi:MAG TPA: DinB family protein [Dehalococcoidia bacterium]|nr:DinB family protein [Dehalococcoidia bacterium]
MDLRKWIRGQHAGMQMLFQANIGSVLPTERLAEKPPHVSYSIAWCIWHIARGEDVAVNTLIRGEPQVLVRGGWDARFGIEDPHPGLGLDDEGEDFVRLADPQSLLEYYAAVSQETKGWLRSAAMESLDEVPDVEGLLLPGAPAAQAAWIREDWAGRPASFFLSWAVIGHGLMHIGEMITVKGQLESGDPPS